MFCYQCEQTSQGKACVNKSVCGKDEITANLQDGLYHVTKELSCLVHALKQKNKKTDAYDRFVREALFATVTNVNFDAERIRSYILTGQDLINRAVVELPVTDLPKTSDIPRFKGTASEMSLAAGAFSIQKRIERYTPDLVGLEELIAYGLKGTAAYAHHARALNKNDAVIDAFFHECLTFLSREQTAGDLLKMALRVGEINYRVMELLDQAHTETYGHPEPTAVRINPIKGKAIVVSGHDLKDLEDLLKQTEGRGINVYTHGEMLPCHAYPGLKKYKHLVGNYGGAWQDQQREFEKFPGAIVMTTNCIQEPRASYRDRIFTLNAVGWPGVKHIEGRDYSTVIETALAQPGFTGDGDPKTIMVGFGHNTVMGVAGKVVEAVKAGAIKHFFLIGGCDGAKSGRNYYTEFAQSVPDDTVILTLACGKYRFNKLDFGTIGGIPRLLDIGQCNDAYSAIKIALALAQAFNTDVNSLPLSMIISWYEQKAVAVLLTLLHLGIKNIRLGPSLPAFITPNILKILVENFNVKTITDAKKDIAACLAT
ncbi:MAG: hydroxylamine reductase [Deltaproteobacteria bacterium]|nr:hydroxylamine reductase [Deltaproteobacteria bacterium]